MTVMDNTDHLNYGIYNTSNGTYTSVSDINTSNINNGLDTWDPAFIEI